MYPCSPQCWTNRRWISWNRSDDGHISGFWTPPSSHLVIRRFWSHQQQTLKSKYRGVGFYWGLEIQWLFPALKGKCICYSTTSHLLNKHTLAVCDQSICLLVHQPAVTTQRHVHLKVDLFRESVLYCSVFKWCSSRQCLIQKDVFEAVVLNCGGVWMCIHVLYDCLCVCTRVS